MFRIIVIRGLVWEVKVVKNIFNLKMKLCLRYYLNLIK